MNNEILKNPDWFSEELYYILLERNVSDNYIINHIKNKEWYGGGKSSFNEGQKSNIKDDSLNREDAFIDIDQIDLNINNHEGWYDDNHDINEVKEDLVSKLIRDEIAMSRSGYNSAYKPIDKYIVPEKYLKKGENRLKNISKSRSDSLPGVYLVMFKVLDKNSKTLVYNYIYYPIVFTDFILAYFISKGDFKNGIAIREWGDYLTVIDKNLGLTDSIDQLKINYRHSSEYYPEIDNSDNTTQFDILDKIIKKINLICNDYSMSVLMDIGFCSPFNEYMNFFNNIYKTYDNVELLLKDFEYHNTSKITNTYMSKSCVFVLQDLNSLKKRLESAGYIVNPGPQSTRGISNSISSQLNCIDIDIRSSLYRHYKYHVNKGNINCPVILKAECFNYKNIHNRIGRARFYSTMVPKKMSIKKCNSYNYPENSPENSPENYTSIKEVPVMVDDYIADVKKSNLNMGIKKGGAGAGTTIC